MALLAWPPAANDTSIAIALFLPLLVPQVSFLFGLQITLSLTGMDGTWPALIYSHMIFIMPYTWMIMAPAFEAMDWRYDQVATSLGKGYQQGLLAFIYRYWLTLGTAFLSGWRYQSRFICQRCSWVAAG